MLYRTRLTDGGTGSRKNEAGWDHESPHRRHPILPGHSSGRYVLLARIFRNAGIPDGAFRLDAQVRRPHHRRLGSQGSCGDGRLGCPPSASEATGSLSLERMHLVVAVVVNSSDSSAITNSPRDGSLSELCTCRRVLKLRDVPILIAQEAMT
jgi:hypothetical protein